jgi:hypothetical protein
LTLRCNSAGILVVICFSSAIAILSSLLTFYHYTTLSAFVKRQFSTYV